jgi:hypothetical protein
LGGPDCQSVGRLVVGLVARRPRRTSRDSPAPPAPEHLQQVPQDVVEDATLLGIAFGKQGSQDNTDIPNEHGRYGHVEDRQEDGKPGAMFYQCPDVWYVASRFFVPHGCCVGPRTSHNARLATGQAGPPGRARNHVKPGQTGTAKHRNLTKVGADSGNRLVAPTRRTRTRARHHVGGASGNPPPWIAPGPWSRAP